MKLILFSTLILGCLPSVFADVLSLKGSHTLTFENTKSGLESAGLEAQKYAAKHAIDQMILNQPSSIKQLYEERKPNILNEILALCTQVKNAQNVDAKKNEITIEFSALIDEDQLKDLLQRKAPIQKQVQLEVMEIAVFFTARNADSVKQQNNAVIQINNLEKRKNVADNGSIDNDGAQSDASIKEEETKTTGTANLVTADQVSYKLDPPAREEFGTSLISRFTEKGFEEIIDGSLFDASTILDQAYGSGDIVPPKTWKDIISNIRTNEPNVQYLIIGTLDIGTPKIDDQTNMWIVEATVSGKIYKMSSNIPRLVAALSPQTQKAKATDQLQAKKRVLSGLTPLAADEILAKLKAKNIIKKP